MITQAQLKELLHYDPETGLFNWRVAVSRSVRVGSIAGSMDKGHGYMRIRVEGKIYYAHRLAWFCVHGHFPHDGLDHINRNRADNRLCNLRLATNAENMQNQSLSSKNTSGHVGVSWHKQYQKWEARIMLNRKTIHLGRFTDLTEAIAARQAAEQKYHPFNSQVTA